MNRSGKEIHRSYDEYGPIQVIDDRAKRYLSFGTDDEQSCQLVHQPHLLQHEYTRGILLVLLMVEPKNLAIVGVGGGCLISTLLHMLPNCNIDAVELRHEVVKIAYKYFQLPRDNRLTIHIDDGFSHLSSTVEDKKDIIIADMYTAEGIDQQQLSTLFIQTCYHKLNKGGWLVLNYWLDHKMEEHLANALQDYFNHVYMCNTGGGNWIIYAGKVNPNKNLIADNKIKPLSKLAGFSLNHFLKRLVVLS